jgi:tetratricopeptide (TPR) repeat protein
LAKQDEPGRELYSIHTLVKDFARDEAEKEGLERKELLIRAARHYENLVETTGSLWDLLKARSYYYQAEEWGRADDIVNAAYDYLIRWGQIELAMNLLDQSTKTISGTRKAVALGNLATVYQSLGDLGTASKLYNEVKEVFEEAGDKRNVSVALHQLGILAQATGEIEEARCLYGESLKIAQELGDKSGVAKSLGQLGNVAYLQGEIEEARCLYGESLKIDQELGDKSGVAKSLGQLGNVAYLQGEIEEARRLYGESLKIDQELGDRRGIAETFGQLGRVDEEEEDYFSALDKYLLALSILKELNDPRSGLAESDISRLREKMGEDAFEKALEEIGRKDGA